MRIGRSSLGCRWLGRMAVRISAWAGHEADGGVIDWIVGGSRSWTVTIPGPGWVLTGRAVFLATTAVAILLLAGIGVVLSRKAELRRRWTTWAIIIPAVHASSASMMAYEYPCSARNRWRCY